MTLVKCPECGKETDASLATCSNCGHSFEAHENNSQIENSSKKISINL